MSKLNWLWQDLRYGFRTLSKDRRTMLIAVIALALGIGASTVIFSVIDGVLLEPFPYRDSDRLVSFYIHDSTRPPQELGRTFFTYPEYTDFSEQNHVFEDMVGFGNTDVLYTNNQGKKLFTGCTVTGNISDFLGMKPLLG